MALAPDPGGRCHDGDLDLARRCGRGDEDAQRSFVDRFGSLVYSICGRRGIEGPDRDDVAQQILLDAFRALPRYQGASRLSTWIYSLSLRRVADQFRSSQRRDVASGWPGDDTFPPSPATSSAQAPDEQAVKAEEGERVRRAVSCLAEPERSVVLAYYLGPSGLSVGEVILRCHDPGSASRASRARRGAFGAPGPRPELVA